MEEVEHFVEVAEESVEGAVGEFLDPGVEDGEEGLCDLLVVHDGGAAGGEVAGIFSFGEPCGGSPIAGFVGGFSDAVEGFDFDGVFGGGEIGGELGIAQGGAGDGAVGATDNTRGDATAAAVGHEGDDFLTFERVERFGASAAVFFSF
ncbi:MAG TPA: hypothetical protein VJL29_00385 [Thermoguttaceae bacterium]|nr:hypothetical protein [Thermoguttaceae bacterium]